jgi:osmotically-inducible protein OsmY
LAFAVACTIGGDTERTVEQALDAASIRNVDVAIEGRANVVHLSGTVQSLADRTRAEEVALAAVGTSGRVVNEIAVAGIGVVKDRETIEP